MSGDPAVAAVADALAGRKPRGVVASDRLVDAAIDQQVPALFAASTAAAALDAPSAARLDAAVRAGAVHGAALDRALRHLLEALARRGLAPLVIKGAHLAHVVYASPHLRARWDTDLLIAEETRPAMVAALDAEGYTPAPLTSGTLILGQFLYRKTLGPGVVHYVDAHWRVASPLVFDRAFDWQTLTAGARPVPALGAAAFAPALPDALGQACVHVVAHHWPAASLRWLYDLRLLADALDDDERERFACGAATGGFRRVAIAALERARAAFPAVGIDRAVEALHRQADRSEPSAVLVGRIRHPLTGFLLDLRTAGWRRSGLLVREHLVPPPSYMRAAFPGWPLPLAYGARLARAVTRRLPHRRG